MTRHGEARDTPPDRDLAAADPGSGIEPSAPATGSAETGPAAELAAARPATGRDRLLVERVQTGVRMEKRLVKVLKALAELYDLSLGDLLEGIVLHAFDGRAPFTEESLRRIADLKRIYGLDLDSRASHRLIEQEPPD
jgi:hypothetical protein